MPGLCGIGASRNPRRALAAGERGAVRHERLRPLFNSVKVDLALWSGPLSQNAAKYALTALVDILPRLKTGDSGY